MELFVLGVDMKNTINDEENKMQQKEYKYICPVCNKEKEFKLLTNIDMLFPSEKFEMAQSERYKELICPNKLFVEFDCGHLYDFHQIDYNENGKISNIIIQ